MSRLDILDEEDAQDDVCRHSSNIICVPLFIRCSAMESEFPCYLNAWVYDSGWLKGNVWSKG